MSGAPAMTSVCAAVAAIAEVAIDGELAVFTAHALQERLLAALDAPGASALRVDVSGVSEVDGAGLQLLVALRHEAARRGIALSFGEPSPAVAEALALTGLASMLASENEGEST